MMLLILKYDEIDNTIWERISLCLPTTQTAT
uniref:Uncharacterized protein n=1 Tax=Rhizophora mucronata TaxID=61149 RepID=A0A2P2Q1I7_RHIMU